MYVLSQNITIFHLKIFIFTAVKYRCILHERVFVMFVPRGMDYIKSDKLTDYKHFFLCENLLNGSRYTHLIYIQQAAKDFMRELRLFPG